MKIKRLLAAAAASVVAVSAMAIVASADALATKTGNAESAVLYDVDLSDLTDDQVKSVTKIEAKVSTTGDMCNGCIGYNKLEKGWTAVNCETKGTAAPASSTWTVEIAAGDLAALNDEGKVAPFVQIQFWWVNPVSEGGADGTASLESVTLSDASGKVVKTFGAAAAAPSTSSTPSNSGDNSGSQSSGDNVNTGVEGVAAVVGVAALAGAALVVARKRK